MSQALIPFVPIRLACYLRQLRLLAKIILLYPLQEPQVGCSVFDLARTLVGCYLSLLAPPLHIATPEHFKCFVLADELRVVGIELQQVDDACGEVVEEGGVAYALVGEVEEYHLQLALLSAHWVWCFVGFITQLVDELKQPVMLAPLVEEKDGESKQQETEGLVKDKVEEEREDTVVLLLSEKEECSCASDDK